ncbi:restriction system-associated AAA family ATPase [Tenacibaculum ovolyticum]|uniref:restriction system-associated AAA family ATPase n=1 Tax=Tenacibaculum ovolyticum TaxID=104270 RepID=UPI0022F3B587|nr:restriction system-associated AAA family ATPase [Tenacibaculum ovolyticum]WBX74861.1 restriction system-associated AAA family ATPase [Tenacibaculum ovolyticum]
MKLLRLQINSPFNSLSNKEHKPFELNFRDPFHENETANWEAFHPFCFAGLNGSGKSNVLEALSNIFYHLECCANINQPEYFRNEIFNAEKSFPDAYELEYYIVPKSKFDTLNTEYLKEDNITVTNIKKSDYIASNIVRVAIIKEEKKAPILNVYNISSNDAAIASPNVVSKDGIQAGSKQYFPDLIIGYSSGENEVLSIPFLKTRLLNYDEYYQSIPKEVYKTPESNLVYIDYEMSQAVLLSNFIFQDNSVLKPLDEHLGIQGVTSFRMTLHLHTIEKESEKYGILDEFKPKIDAFKKCATTFYEKNDTLTLDFWINLDTKFAFKKHFKDIYSLFQTFQILYTLNHRIVKPEHKKDVYGSEGFYTDWKLPKPAPEEKVFYFEEFRINKRINKEGDTIKLLMKNLSDGEQQFLHSLGICLMLKGKSALLLLDEPETHFNPDWRSKFISTLKVCLEASGSNNLMRDILITSHSPFIISDCYPNKVIVFERDKQPKNARELSIHTYGTSVNLLTTKIFGKKETIGEYSLDKIDIYRKEFYDGGDANDIMRRLNEELGDSIEKLLFIKEMHSKSK